MHEYLLDFAGPDGAWTPGVRVYIDPRTDRVYLPAESADRVQLPPEAEPAEFEVRGTAVRGWAVSAADLTTRPASGWWMPSETPASREA